ncbi:MAG: hypothetical protein KBB95_25480 [Deltaproteobacteria bacterium]|nr:hypothetical protein [Deltaproteobacteria bacterium]
MKGRHMGTCSGCGEKKGDRDSNAGWYELSPRGAWSGTKKMLFCPPCAGALLVGLDEKMDEGKKNPNLLAMHRGDLLRILRVLQEVSMQGLDVNVQNERSLFVDMLARLVKRVPWASFAGGFR